MLHLAIDFQLHGRTGKGRFGGFVPTMEGASEERNLELRFFAIVGDAANDGELPLFGALHV